MAKYSKNLKLVFGMRTIKTAIATSLTVFLAKSMDINTPILAGISVIVSMQSSIFDSYKISMNRILSTIIGAIIASIFQFFHFTNIFAMMIGIILVINICNFLNWKQTITLSCIIFIMILLYEPIYETDPSYFMYSIYRLSDTTLGLVVGFLVNYFIAPPSREIFLLSTYKKSLKEFEDYFLLLLAGTNKIKIEKLIDDINQINIELKSIKNDRKLFKNKDFNISNITNINYDFYSAFGLLSQLSELKELPNISDDNIYTLKEYFSYSPVIISTTEDNKEEFVFNYYIKELIDLLYKLNKNIENFETRIKE